MGILFWDLTGRIVDANDAFLRIVGYSRDDLSSGRMDWKELTAPEWREVDERHIPELMATGIAEPYEKEYVHKDGSRVPVLIGGATFEGEQAAGVAFVVDLTDRKEGRSRPRAKTNAATARWRVSWRTRIGLRRWVNYQPRSHMRSINPSQPQ